MLYCVINCTQLSHGQGLMSGDRGLPTLPTLLVFPPTHLQISGIDSSKNKKQETPARYMISTKILQKLNILS